MAKSQRKKRILRVLLIALLIIVAGVGYSAYELYNRAFRPNVVLRSSADAYIYLHTGWNFGQVRDMLYSQGVIQNRSSFEWLAEQKNYPNNVKPGRYKLKAGMSNNDLINMLRSGQQAPVRITFNNIRYPEQLASRIGKQLEADSTELLQKMKSAEAMSDYGLTPFQALVMMIPNTYEFFWNTSAEQFLERMYREYRRFWTEERKEKAARIPLTPVDVSILASIVESETNKEHEMSRIAGVYINRLKKGMLLQADPTAKYAANDPGIRRVLHRHLQIDSPYNTYLYPGLPPGPICMPSPVTIDKVLDYETHDYLFFCAKEDFSGEHVFAKTGAQHAQNAARFHRAMNQRNIR